MSKLVLAIATILFSIGAFAHDNTGNNIKNYEDGLTFCGVNFETQNQQCISFSNGIVSDSLADHEKKYVVSRNKGTLLISTRDKHRNLNLAYSIVTEEYRVILVPASAPAGVAYGLNGSYGPCYEQPWICM